MLFFIILIISTTLKHTHLEMILRFVMNQCRLKVSVFNGKAAAMSASIASSRQTTGLFHTKLQPTDELRPFFILRMDYDEHQLLLCRKEYATKHGKMLTSSKNAVMQMIDSPINVPKVLIACIRSCD